MKRRVVVPILIILLLGVSLTWVRAEPGVKPSGPSGGGFELTSSVLAGGGGLSTGGGFSVDGTIGQPSAGVASGGGYTLLGGFWSAAQPRVIQVPNFFVDVSASSGGTTVSLGRAIELHDVIMQEGQPLPAGTVPWSGPVIGTTFNAALTLGVTSFDPLILSLQRFQISLPTGQSADISNIGNTTLTVPGTTSFTKSATQSVSGIGDVTFTFTGQAETVSR